MKKITGVLFIVFGLVLLGIFINGLTSNQKTVSVQPDQLQITPTLPFASYEAQFAIYTNGTRRIFSESKYHNQSEDIFLEAENPNIIQIKKPNLTWNDLFTTLPMNLSKDCLITGTKQTFCTNETSTLKFYINGIRNDNALNEEINNGDKLLVSYGPESDPNISQQLSEISVTK